jgi:two-component system NarL family sensor kinase
LAHLAKTMNEMLDTLAAGRERMRRIGADVVFEQERERARVARELHDSVGQTLVAASFQIAVAANDLGSDAGGARLAEARELMRTAVEEIRNVARSLHPRVADDLGLPLALEALADLTRQRSLVDVRVRTDVSGVTIPAPLATTLYRIAQEALRNVEKHADAGLALVTLRARPGFVELEVRDDGCGFGGPLEQSRHDSSLVSMRQRLSLAGGELHIDSTRENGTRVLARIGLEMEAA